MDMKPKQVSHLKWKISNFSGGFYNLSPNLFDETGIPWKLELSKFNNHIRYLSLHKRMEMFSEVTVDCQFYFAKENGAIFLNSEVKDIKGESYFRLLTDFNIPNNLGMTENNVEITLILKKHIEMENPSSGSFESDFEFRRYIQESVVEDLEKLYDNHVNSDVSLSMEGETLDVHKAILSARSPVFAAMFQQGMVEAGSNVIVIEDVKMATMKEVVAFMYGKARRDYDYDTAMEMYYATDKYDVKKLKKICRDIIAKQVNEGNVYDILSLSDRHHEPVLKQSAMTFINANLRSCVTTEWWCRLMSSKTELSAEVAKYVLDNK